MANLKIKKGFTLVELMVGMTIFTLILAAVIGILISGIKIQRLILSQQQALDQLSFAIEYMSRALRMAKREDGTFACLSNDLSYQNPNSPNISSVRFINHLQGDDCQEFSLGGPQGNQIKYSIKINQVREDLYLTSSGLTIQALSFKLQGESKSDTIQPRITIFLNITSPLILRLQTTISQRNLDI